MEAWRGSLILKNGHSISDIHLSTSGTAAPNIIPPKARLRFLAFVDPSRIPLHLIYGPRLDVWTTKHEAQDWFSDALLDSKSNGAETEWWHTARPESPLGVLAALDTEETTPSNQPRVTEILFLASRNDSGRPYPSTPPTPPHSSQGNNISPADPVETTLRLHAYTLSSDLYHGQRVKDITPPTSPPLQSNDSIIRANSLSNPFLLAPPVPPTNPLKRKSIDDTFAEAEALRKRKRAQPGESVQAASAPTRNTPIPSLKPQSSNVLNSALRRTSESGASSSTRVEPHPRPRSPSVLSKSKVTQQRDRSNTLNTSTHSHSPNKPTTSTTDPSTLESKNKTTISRLVMAGMRLHGLSQSKKPTPSNPSNISIPSEEQENNEQYKLIYHQIFKSTCFAFRTHMAVVLLQGHTEVLRGVVEKLLGLFCGDPLAEGLGDDAGEEGIEAEGDVYMTPVVEIGREEGFDVRAAGGRDRENGGEVVTSSLRKRQKDG